MFQIYQHTICVEAGWLYNDAGLISKANYKKHCQRGKIKKVRRGCKGTPALVAYETLPADIQQQIIDQYGDPTKLTQTNPLEDIIEIDLKAIDFYKAYRMTSGETLPEQNINQYIAEASIYNAALKMATNIHLKRKALGAKRGNVWAKIADLAQQLPREKYPHKLPANPRRFKGMDENSRSLRRYRKYGYEGLIHGNFLNTNSQKINEDAKLWVLNRWSNQIQRCATIQQLLHEYNQEAEIQGWKQLKDDKALRNYLYEPKVESLWYAHRHGELKAKEKFNYQHTTKLPTMRDSLWYSDGTKLNYYYLDEGGKMQTCQVYEVMDAYSEVLLGYHISKTEDYEAQYNAYKMAIQTAGHKPYQIGFDGQGGHKKLEAGDFLTKMSRISVKTAPYNGKSKTIESAFGRLQEHYLKKDWFFTGQNITAKKLESKANMEFILANKSNLPSLEEIKKVYEERRADWNNAKHPHHELSRIEVYKNSTNTQAPPLSIWDMVDMFWITRPKAITVNAYGINFTEKKEKYQYMVNKPGTNVPDVRWLRNNIDKKFIIKYDPQDMSMIYLYEDGPLGLRLVTEAYQKIEVQRNVQEQEEFDREFTRMVNDEVKIVREESYNQMESILESFGNSAEQQGFNKPNIKGVNSSKAKKEKRKVEPTSYAHQLKVVSNYDDSDEIENYEDLL